MGTLEKHINGVKWWQIEGVNRLSRSKSKKNSVRLSVTLDEGEYAALTRIGTELDLSAAWMIRRAVSEFVVRHGKGVATDLPLQRPNSELPGRKRVGGSRGA